MSWISVYIHSDLQPVYVAKSRDAGKNATMELVLSVQRPVQKKSEHILKAGDKNLTGLK